MFDDKGQVSLEQMFLISGVFVSILVAVYFIKTEAKKLTHVEKKAANVTLNKSV